MPVDTQSFVIVTASSSRGITREPLVIICDGDNLIELLAHMPCTETMLEDFWIFAQTRRGYVGRHLAVLPLGTIESVIPWTVQLVPLDLSTERALEASVALYLNVVRTIPGAWDVPLIDGFTSVRPAMLWLTVNPGATPEVAWLPFESGTFGLSP